MDCLTASLTKEDALDVMVRRDIEYVIEWVQTWPRRPFDIADAAELRNLAYVARIHDMLPDW